MHGIDAQLEAVMVKRSAQQNYASGVETNNIKLSYARI